MAVKLEHREFVLDTEVHAGESEDAVEFWIRVSHMSSPALQLLSIPSSNADSERVFSLVRRIRTEFRSSLPIETLSALIGCHFNKTTNCCEKVPLEESLPRHAQHQIC